MQVDGQDVIVISREKIEAMYNALGQTDAGKFYLAEDKNGSVRFGVIEEIPATYRRKPLSLST